MIARRTWLQLAAAAELSRIVGPATAQDSRNYPDRAIHLVVAKPTGGLDDTITRVLQPDLQRVLGQPVVVENVPGANGIIGTKNVIRAQPDGYRLLVINTRLQLTAGELSETPVYDLLRDITPIVSFAEFRIGMLANSAAPGRDLREILNYAKANPHKIAYGSTGPGSLAHLVGAVAAQMSGAEMLHVPYKGGGPGAVAVMAGEIQLFTTDLNTALNAQRTGRARLVAQSGEQRSAEAPDAPLFSELGFDLFRPLSLAIVGPQGLDGRVVDKVAAAVRQAVATPAVREAIRKAGGEVNLVDGAGLRSEMQRDMANWIPQAKAVMATANPQR